MLVSVSIRVATQRSGGYPAHSPHHENPARFTSDTGHFTLGRCSPFVKIDGAHVRFMIAGFRHKGLKRFYEKDERKGVPPDLADKIARILARLDVARAPEQMDLPGLKLHSLKGDLKGFWSVWVSGNWRIIFRFDGTDVTQVDLVDYH